MDVKLRVATFATTAAVMGSLMGVLAGAPAWASTGSGSNGAKLLSEVQSAVASQRGFWWSDKGVEEGTTAYETTEVGKTEGSQSLTAKQAGGSATLSLLVIGTTAYFEGNSKGLNLLGFSPGAQSSEAGKWISVTEAADPSVYQEMAGSLTSSSVASTLAMAGPVSELSSKKILGQSVIELKGTAAPTSGQQTGTTDTIYVAATGKPLPVEVIQDNASVGNTYTFSHWGAAPHVKAPKHAVAYQTSWT